MPRREKPNNSATCREIERVAFFCVWIGGIRLFGRRVIYSSVDVVDRTNLPDVLVNAGITHTTNQTEIDYLWDYYRGKQPILHRVKEIRPEINNMIVENRANEIVSFKVGYLCGEPIQYISTSDSEDVASAITRLNEYMRLRNKTASDHDLIEWQMIAGTGYRLIIPDSEYDPRFSVAPFKFYVLDPRRTFVIYSSKIGNEPLAGVYFTTNDLNERRYHVYTKDMYYEVVGGAVVVERPHTLGVVPILEYPANNARLGSFEIVIPILDAINNIQSNRMDGIEQFVQSLMVFYNCQLGDDEDGNPITPAAIREAGAIFLKSIGQEKADLKILSEQLNQTQTQTLVDDLYQAVLDICGMPNRNGSSSTSDTGTAVFLRDGHGLAEGRAMQSELMFKQPEREFLSLALKIAENLTGMQLRLGDIEIKFTRRNYENIQTKSQVLVTMLNNAKIDPRLAFIHCGMFSDPEEAYRESAAYYEAELARTETSLREELANVSADRHDDSVSTQANDPAV